MIDLHTHSTHSDGSFTPTELVEQAARQGITLMSLTDHDTLSGIEEAQVAASKTDVKFVVGVELSCRTPSSNVHLLGYGFDQKNQALQEEITLLQNSRSNRNQLLINRLQSLGFNITFDGVLRHSTDGVVGRPHFAKELIELGHFDSIEHVFQVLLGDGAEAYIPRVTISARKAISRVHDAGGIVSWAHPPIKNAQHECDIRRELSPTLEQLIDCGLDGIEAWCARFTPVQRVQVAKLGKDLGLVCTGGSDFHGYYKPDIFLGTGTGDLNTPKYVADMFQ